MGGLAATGLYDDATRAALLRRMEGQPAVDRVGGREGGGVDERRVAVVEVRCRPNPCCSLYFAGGRYGF
jgi:hypothetical protein